MSFIKNMHDPSKITLKYATIIQCHFGRVRYVYDALKWTRLVIVHNCKPFQLFSGALKAVQSDKD